MALYELIDDNPVPRDGVKRVAALDREAACDKVGIEMTPMTHAVIASGMAMVVMTVSKYMSAGSMLQLIIESNDLRLFD